MNPDQKTRRPWRRPTSTGRYRIVLVSALWLICTSAHGQSASSGAFVSDAANGCKVWNPHPQPNETVAWTGACVDGLAQGAGSLQWLNNKKPYETDQGEWNQGRQTGRGSQDWGSGRYEGELLNGEPHGRGVLTLQSARYAGEFRGGKPNGAGTVTNLEGLFKGIWKDGCLVGDKRKISFAVPSSSCR